MNPFARSEIRIAAVCLALLGIAAVPAVAQQEEDGTNVGELLRLADEFRALRQAQMSRAWGRSLGIETRMTTPGGRVAELVGWNAQGPLYYITMNADAAVANGAARVHPGGGSGYALTGAGVLLGIWDGGRIQKHNEFGNRVQYGDGAQPASGSDHGTHVAGTMASGGLFNTNSSRSSRGMAYAATLRSYDWNDDISEMAAMAANVALRARISNHSYGLLAGWSFGNRGDNRWTWFGGNNTAVEDAKFGAYLDISRAVDLLVNSAQSYLPVVAAANDRNDDGPTFPGTGQPLVGANNYYWTLSGGSWVQDRRWRKRDGDYDSIPGGLQTAKNVLTVGAINSLPAGYTGPASVVSTAFSSWGPTDDGRIKPDVVGDGDSLWSTIPVNSYDFSSGTSMASPSVAGALGLVLQRWRTFSATDPWSSTLKALAIGTAREAGVAPGPDYRFGWGLLNTERAVRQVDLDQTSPNAIVQGTVVRGTTLTYQVVMAGTTELRATLVWNDPAAAALPNPIVDDPTRKLSNDLDLRVEKGPQVFLPWVLNPTSPASAATRGDNNRDNVEQVVVNGAAGIYTVRVRFDGPVSPTVSQRFSLIVQGMNPPKTISSAATVRGGTGLSANIALAMPADVSTTVSLTSSNNALASWSAPSATFAPGTTTRLMTVTTRRVTRNTTVTLTAQGSGRSVTRTITLTP